MLFDRKEWTREWLDEWVEINIETCRPSSIDTKDLFTNCVDDAKEDGIELSRLAEVAGGDIECYLATKVVAIFALRLKSHAS